MTGVPIPSLRERERRAVSGVPGICLCVASYADTQIFTCEALSPSDVVNASAMLQVKDPDAFQESVVQAKDPTVVMFWATWCPFCRRFKQEFEKLAASRPWHFAAVYLDDEENPLWEDYAVEDVPTPALFRGGKRVDDPDRILRSVVDRTMLDDFINRLQPDLA